MQVEFPPSFLWGAALSSYQSEGSNLNADWYQWEKEKNLESSGLACDHYRLFETDFSLASQLGLNSIRLSLEWSRIFPKPDLIAQDQIDHYQQVVNSLIKHKLKPILTLHHFTNPVWFAEKGGWSNQKNIDYFLKYLKTIVEPLKHKVEYWLIFNEPLVYLYQGFIRGIWPPGEKSINQAQKAIRNIITAYILGYQEIKRIYQGTNIEPKISLAKNLRIFSPCPGLGSGLNSLSAFLRNQLFNFPILNYLHSRKTLDFIGLNYYCKEYTQFKGLLGTECSHASHKERRNYLGWYMHPEGLYSSLKKLKKFNLPILITENGTAERAEDFYEDYLTSHLQSLAQAVKDGINITGYLWWSLLDNFEWDKGFGPRFGLVNVDYGSFKRKIKPFAYTYGKICRENKIWIKDK